MRVISGKAKGCKLIAPTGLTTRPTTDRIKETIFNMLAPDIPNAIFLDLFSGSGAMGIEALSRGAQKAYFIDESSTSMMSIQKNLEHTKLERDAVAVRQDFRKALSDFAQRRVQFDIIFMDPPYQRDFIQLALNVIVHNELLYEGGIIVLEQSANEINQNFQGFQIVKSKKTKTTSIVFLKK